MTVGLDEAATLRHVHDSTDPFNAMRIVEHALKEYGKPLVAAEVHKTASQEYWERDNRCRPAYSSPEERMGWGLLISCARATRGRGLPSPGLMARLGVPVGGRVRKSRAVGDQSAPILERLRASLEGPLDRKSTRLNS